MFLDALLQSFPLIEEQLICQLGIAHRVIARGRAELVVLHQPVIGVLRECDRREFQRIDQRQLMEGQVWMEDRQRGLVECDDIVAEDESSALRQLIKLGDEILSFTRNSGARISIRTESTDLPQDRSILASGFNIEAETFCPLLCLWFSHNPSNGWND